MKDSAVKKLVWLLLILIGLAYLLLGCRERAFDVNHYYTRVHADSLIIDIQEPVTIIIKGGDGTRKIEVERPVTITILRCWEDKQ